MQISKWNDQKVFTCMELIKRFSVHQLNYIELEGLTKTKFPIEFDSFHENILKLIKIRSFVIELIYFKFGGN